MGKGEIKLDQGAIDDVVSIHRRAGAKYQAAGDGRPSGDMGEGGDEVVAIMTKLGMIADAIGRIHLDLGEQVVMVARSMKQTDELQGTYYGGGGQP